MTKREILDRMRAVLPYCGAYDNVKTDLHKMAEVIAELFDMQNDRIDDLEIEVVRQKAKQKGET